MVTEHSLKRAKQRIGINKKYAERQIRLARERGKRADQFKSLEKKYLSRTVYEECEPIVYDGYCYLFSNEGNCITIYPLPNWFGKKKHYDGKTKIKKIKTYYKNNYEITKNTMQFELKMIAQ